VSDRHSEPIAAIVVDDERRVLQANDAALELFGTTRERLVGVRVDDGAPLASGTEDGWTAFLRRGVAVGTATLRTTEGLEDVPYISVARVAPGRHMTVLMPSYATAGGTGSLSRREREVVALVAAGATGREVGEALSVTTSTVETHIRNAMRRLGARNRSHLVTLAIARREIDLGDLLKQERLARLKR
jgi:DNA-binding CsgD family transcriptional regulator